MFHLITMAVCRSSAPAVTYILSHIIASHAIHVFFLFPFFPFSLLTLSQTPLCVLTRCRSHPSFKALPSLSHYQHHHSSLPFIASSKPPSTSCPTPLHSLSLCCYVLNVLNVHCNHNRDKPTVPQIATSCRLPGRLNKHLQI